MNLSRASLGFPGGSVGKKICLQCGRPGFNPWVGKSPGEGSDNPLQYSCLENPHRQRSLAGYSPWGCKELGMTEQLTLSHIRFTMLTILKCPVAWCVCMKSLSHVRLFVTPWTVACQAPLFMGFSSKNTRVGNHSLLQVSS